MKKYEPRARVVIENILPQVEGGKFPIKRIAGEAVYVTADMIADGHDEISARLMYRKIGSKKWLESPLNHIENDVWEGHFRVDTEGEFEYAVTGLVDHALTRFKGFQESR